jgi:hypothetical protein
MMIVCVSALVLLLLLLFYLVLLVSFFLSQNLLLPSWQMIIHSVVVFVRKLIDALEAEFLQVSGGFKGHVEEVSRRHTTISSAMTALGRSKLPRDPFVWVSRNLVVWSKMLKTC